MNTHRFTTLRHTLSTAILSLAIAVFAFGAGTPAAWADDQPAPAPLLHTDGQPLDWWFVFKFNTKAFPECGKGVERACTFGGEVQDYRYGYSQQYVYASSADPTLKKGGGCAGDTLDDPVGATFARVYQGKYYYVVWNDQFYDDPKIKGCSKSCSSPWGHAKGIVAWNEAGEGMVMQVTTPSWPGAADADHPRADDGNTLGCVEDDNVMVSQHFFSLRLKGDDVKMVLKALANASVVTDPTNPQIVRNGGPEEVQALVKRLGKKVDSEYYTHDTLSTGVQLISKPSKLHVPPWQLVSTIIDGRDLRVATWWARPTIPSTSRDDPVGCWRDDLGKPGAVVNATEGSWDGTDFGLKGGLGKDFNHAKIGVSTSEERRYAIFGDMNQQGALSEGNTGKYCDSSQNGRGGTFYVVDNPTLNAAVGRLIGVQ